MLRSIIDFIMGLFFPGPGEDEKRLPAAEDEGTVVTEEPPDEPEPEPAGATPTPVEATETPVDPEPILPADSSTDKPQVDIVVPEPEPEHPYRPIPEPEPVGIQSVGAWVGQASFGDPARDVRFCRENNIDRLQIICNDHSKWRSARDFNTYDYDRIVRLAKEAKDAGIDVELMTWMMPHADYIDQAANTLLKLLDDTGGIGIEIDAEEPWTQAKGAMPYADAAARINERFRPGMGERELGVNFIGYTPVSKVGPLAAIADYGLVQAYATSSNTLKPETVVPKLYRRTRDKLNPQRIDVGLAAYRQSGIPGHTVRSAMTASLAGAQAIEGVTRVTYWSLRWIRKSHSVAQFIRGIDKVAPPGSPRPAVA